MSEYRIKEDGSEDILLTATQTGTLGDGRKVGSADVHVKGSSSLNAAVKNVTTAGARVQLHADRACRKVTIIAKRANTGYIYVGGSDVSSTVYGAELAAQDSIDIEVSNLNLVYIDSSVNGEGVSYVAV